MGPSLEQKIWSILDLNQGPFMSCVFGAALVNWKVGSGFGCVPPFSRMTVGSVETISVMVPLSADRQEFVPLVMDESHCSKKPPVRHWGLGGSIMPAEGRPEIGESGGK